MLPYFPQPSLHLFGQVTLYPVWVMLGLGFFFGIMWMRRRFRDAGLDPNLANPTLLEVFFPAVVLGHIFDVLAYSPGRLVSEGPHVLLRFLNGNSSLGGFFSTLIAYFFYLRRRLPREKWVVAYDVLIQGIVVGQIFGRLGCTLVHDHPGRLTRFPLALAYPGGARHDLGFDEFLLMGLVIFPTTLWMHRRKAKPGTQFAVVMLIYGAARFFLDFLRAVDLPGSDVRYLGLTPAQYLAVVMFLIGAVCLQRLYGRAARTAPARQEIDRG